MKKEHFIGFCAAVMLSASGLAAQTAPQTTPQTPSTTPGSQSTMQQDRGKSGEMKTVTVTGCLRGADAADRSADTTSTSGTQATPGTAGRTGTQAASGQFVLSNAKVTSGNLMAGSTQTPPATGTSGSATAGTMQQGGMMFRLEPANNTVNLSEHINHQVEVTGTLDANAMGKTMSSTAPHGHAGTSSTQATSPGSMPGGTPGATSTAQQADRDQMKSDKAGKQGARLKVTSIRMISATCS